MICKDFYFLKKLLCLLSVFLFLINNLVCQKNISIYKDDFVFDSSVYRIKVWKKDKEYQFEITYRNKSTKFSQFNIDKPNVLKLNLGTAIATLQKLTAPDQLDPMKLQVFKIAHDSIVGGSDSMFVFTEEQQVELKASLDSLSRIGQCLQFYESGQVKEVLAKSQSDTLKLSINDQSAACQKKETELSALQESNLDLIIDVLHPRLIKADRVDLNDASVAGRIFLKDTIRNIYYDDEPCHKIIQGMNRLLDRKKKNYKDHMAKFRLSVNNGEYNQEAERLLDDINDYHRQVDEEKSKCAKIRRNDKTYFVPDSAQLEFANGALLNIKIKGTLSLADGTKIHDEIFHNNIPLPFATKTATNFLYRSANRNAFYLRSARTHLGYAFNISEAIHSIYNLLLDTENYSPKKQVVKLYPGGKGKLLLKEENHEILKAKVFTDLVGLRNNRPNGLIQLEFSKRLNLSTRIFSRGRAKSQGFFHLFNYIEPIFTLSKIEDDDDVLVVNKTPIADSLVNSVLFNDILRYRKSSLGVTLNILNWGVPGFQSHLHVGVLGNLNLTSFKDTNVSMANGVFREVDSTFTALSHDIGFEVSFEVNPSDKYNLCLKYSQRWHRIYVDDPTFIPVSNSKLAKKEIGMVDSNQVDKSRKYHQFEMLASAMLSKTGDLFFRGRYQFLSDDANQNFFQIQLGYSFYFFGRNK